MPVSGRVRVKKMRRRDCPNLHTPAARRLHLPLFPSGFWNRLPALLLSAGIPKTDYILRGREAGLEPARPILAVSRHSFEDIAYYFQQV